MDENEGFEIAINLDDLLTLLVVLAVIDRGAMEAEAELLDGEDADALLDDTIAALLGGE